MSTVIDTSNGMSCFRFLQIYHALKLEVKTGLHHSRGSIMNLARREYDITKRTKKGVLVELYTIGLERGYLK